MPRERNKLTALQVASRTLEPGRHGDGGGLWLQVRDTRRRSWLFRYMLDGKAREMGLGPAPDVALTRARELADQQRALLREGKDPITHRDAVILRNKADTAKQAVLLAQTFKVVAEEYLEAHASTWRNEKHKAQWRSTLMHHAYPKIGNIPVAAIGLPEITSVLSPIWHKTPETASRLRMRLEAILDYAGVKGWRSGDNPARWTGWLSKVLPNPKSLAPVENHPSLPYDQIGAFMAKLRKTDGIASRALELTIYTATRTSEVRGAQWGEFDLAAAVWTIPGERMKAGKEHRVPLSAPAVALLQSLIGDRTRDGDRPVFPSPGKLTSLSINAMRAVLIRMGYRDITVHGFRSTFRVWAAERAPFPREVVEAALAHKLKDKAEAAYQRSDHFARRAKLMETWAHFCSQPLKAADVTHLRAANA